MAGVAQACLLGVPAQPLVYGDALERMFWQAVADQAVALDALRRDNQATAYANSIAGLFKRWRGSRRAG